MQTVVKKLLVPGKWILMGSASMFLLFNFLYIMWTVTKADLVSGGNYYILGNIFQFIIEMGLFVVLIVAMFIKKDRIVERVSFALVAFFLGLALYTIPFAYDATTSGLVYGLTYGYKEDTALIINMVAAIFAFIACLGLGVSLFFGEKKAGIIIRFIGIWVMVAYVVMKIAAGIAGLAVIAKVDWGMVMDFLAVFFYMPTLFFLYLFAVCKKDADAIRVRRKKVIIYEDEEEPAPAEEPKAE